MAVYLDNSATTRPCEQAVSAMIENMREGFHNPSALYAPAMMAEREVARARAVIAAAVGADEKRVIFTSGGTESDNLAVFGLLQSMRKTGDVLYTAAEHPAVKNACIEAAERFGLKAREIPLTKEGLVDLAALEEMLSEETRLICVTQVCNETGVIMPLSEICALRGRLAPQAAIHVDGVQGFLREAFSMKALPVQSYAVSSHKIRGPKGVGALIIREGTRLHGQMSGGGQQQGLRGGTENTCGIAGFCAAVECYPSEANARMRLIKQKLTDTLTTAMPEAVIVGLPADEAMSAWHILSIAFPPVRAETLLHALEADGIYVGTGSACSSKKGKRSQVLTAMKMPNEVMDGAIRISLSPDNTEAELDFAAEKIIENVKRLRVFSRR